MQTRLIDLHGVIQALRSIEGVLWADARVLAPSAGPNEIVGMVSGSNDLKPKNIMQTLQSAFPSYCLPHRVVVVREKYATLAA